MYTLRKLQDADTELVQAWLNQDYIAKWFGNSSEWMVEINGRNKDFAFIKHFIIESDGQLIGFCQYYDCSELNAESSEKQAPSGVYGIDYLIGEASLLGKGIGKQIVKLICDEVLADQAHVIQITADPTIEKDNVNIASIRALKANQFCYDKESRIFRKLI